MKIGIGHYYLNHYGFADGVAKMAEDGYECLDFSLEDTESEYYTKKDESFLGTVHKLRRDLKAGGITVEQIHGPLIFPPKDSTAEDRADLFEKLTKAAVVAKYLGAKYMAVHPLMPYGADSDEDPEGVYALNLEFFKAITNVASKLGVVLCLENQPFANFPLSSPLAQLRLVREVAHPSLKVCYDAGHANLVGGRISEDLKEIGDELRILHLNDNYGDTDSHNALFDGSFNWAELAEVLFDVGFDGVIDLECDPVKSDEKVTDDERREREKALARYAKLIAG